MINTLKMCRRIADKRKNIGMTQGELAVRVGVTAQAVSKWERGISCPDISILDELAEILEMTVSELLGVA